ncbi:hypothetical protein [Peterkaempfera bronchialis]|uniref:hypothetical protein n=1 Tax=Peterkaempfera bronchialis TaxID=2126346 RepID=UPI003C2EFAD9
MTRVLISADMEGATGTVSPADRNGPAPWPGWSWRPPHRTPGGPRRPRGTAPLPRPLLRHHRGRAVAGAAILHAWIGLPLWVLAMGLMAMMTATNLLSVRSPFFPYLTWVVMAGFAAVLVAMAVIGDQRTQLFTSLGSLAVVLLAYTVRRARGPRARADRRR